MLFSRKKNLLQQVATNSWRTDADKEALLEQIKAQDLKPLEAIPLIWHADALVRKLGVDLFMAKPNAEAVRALVLSMGDKPNHQRAFVTRIYARIPADAMQPIVDELISHKDAGSLDAYTRLGEILGRSLKDIQSIAMTEMLVSADDADTLRAAAQATLMDGKPFHAQLRMRRGNGSEFYADISGRRRSNDHRGDVTWLISEIDTGKD